MITILEDFNWSTPGQLASALHNTHIATEICRSWQASLGGKGEACQGRLHQNTHNYSAIRILVRHFVTATRQKVLYNYQLGYLLCTFGLLVFKCIEIKLNWQMPLWPIMSEMWKPLHQDFLITPLLTIVRAKIIAGVWFIVRFFRKSCYPHCSAYVCISNQTDNLFLMPPAFL